MTTRTCRGPLHPEGLQLPLTSENFYVDNGSYSGFFYYCKPCAKHKRSVQPGTNYYTKKNLTKVCEFVSHVTLKSCTRMTTDDLDYCAWHNNPLKYNSREEFLVAQRIIQGHYIKDWYFANRYDILKRQRDWYRNNPLEAKAAQAAGSANTRAKAYGIEGRLSYRDVIEVWEIDKFCCVQCGLYMPAIPGEQLTPYTLTIDHIVALAIGGINTIDNIQTMCMSHNVSKGIKVIDYRYDNSIPITHIDELIKLGWSI